MNNELLLLIKKAPRYFDSANKNSSSRVSGIRNEETNGTVFI